MSSLSTPKPHRITSVPTLLTVEWPDGTVGAFDSLWLRDNCPDDRDPHSGQRLVDVVDLPENPTIRSAVLHDSVVSVEWDGESRRTSFSLEWLAAHFGLTRARRTGDDVRMWLEGGTLDATRNFSWLTHDLLSTDVAARARWLGNLLRDGIAFVRDVPRDEAAVVEVAGLLGCLFETNYGRTFDVRSVPRPENLAYSDVGLGLHTDNPYREPVPGFQALHVLIAAPEGGESLFADGFAIAAHLRTSAPDAFARLSRQAVPFRYRSREAELYAERPLIQLSFDGRISAVHYNNRSIAPLDPLTPDVRAFYRAYRQFATLLREPCFQMKALLAEGDLVVFDNQRILHGRTAYSSISYSRHLRGCYLTRDSVRSQAAVLARKLSEAGAAEAVR